MIDLAYPSLSENDLAGLICDEEGHRRGEFDMGKRNGWAYQCAWAQLIIFMPKPTFVLGPVMEIIGWASIFRADVRFSRLITRIA
jgi:hypothetical protein